MARKNNVFTKNTDLMISKKYHQEITKELDLNHNLKLKVNHCLEEFIKFAALERLEYEPNLIEEIDEFFKRTRVYVSNNKLWDKIRIRIFKRDNYTCIYCNKIGGKLEVDHIIPFSKGGSEDDENLATSCLKCNRQKKDKSVNEFIEWRNQDK